MDKKLQVKGLTISFRTSHGKLQAVRNIDFDLAKGETLAIVGESGSGKSVTSKAILGILAGNSIVEGGEIIYDGKDLLKLSEDDFHKIRGDKIAMIFQDPMSSLNPIIKIGKQLTEAMILKGKARQRESKLTFNTFLTKLNAAMVAAASPDAKATLTKKCKDFDKFEYKHLELEAAYNVAFEAATELVPEIENILFEIEKHALKDGPYRFKRVSRLALDAINPWVVSQKDAELKAACKVLKKRKIWKTIRKTGDYSAPVSALTTIKQILEEALTFVKPNFFAMGYYLTFSGQKEVPSMGVTELNAYLRKYLDDTFMLAFIDDAQKGVRYSAETSAKEMREAIAFLKENRKVFEVDALEKKVLIHAWRLMTKEVMDALDPLSTVKDSQIYTFGTGLKTEIDKYFNGIVKNRAEKKRYAKQKAQYDRLVARGKEPEWQVVPESLTDLPRIHRNCLDQIDRLIAHLEKLIAETAGRNFEEETVALIDFLKANASGVVNKVTKSIAKAKAIKLMEEVGIPEPRKRYNQYPFEFSGGMRQRIVIAIALAANPDILICDEPTTALDVRIQSQILELINKLKAERQLSIIFITHDLGVVANMADRIAVMYAGKIVEYGTAEDIFYRSAHPYTWALLSSMPDLDTNEKLDSIPGTPPDMIYPPVGDAFAERNKYAMKIDFERQPPMFKISDSHYAATWLLHPDAPKIDPPKAITDRIARMQAKRGVEE